jgi:hypothetical protein
MGRWEESMESPIVKPPLHDELVKRGLIRENRINSLGSVVIPAGEMACLEAVVMEPAFAKHLLLAGGRGSEQVRLCALSVAGLPIMQYEKEGEPPITDFFRKTGFDISPCRTLHVGQVIRVTLRNLNPTREVIVLAVIVQDEVDSHRLHEVYEETLLQAE